MNNGFPTPQQVAMTRLNYPSGCRIQLDDMQDPYSPVPPGTCGTFQMVDSSGHIYMEWDNGRMLSLIPGMDSFHRIDQKMTQSQSMGGMKL